MFREFLKEIRKEERVEGELIKTVFISIVTSFVVLGILYFLRFSQIEGFMAKQGIFIFFVALSYAFLTPTIRQVRAYGEMPCMSGMMVGMTSGMIAGFLPGFYVGATNGMFVGSVFGMGLGIILGIWNGKCCGVMGFMEGMMAGFMGGLMGAMTAFMLFNDHLMATSIIVFIICSIILFGLNYMIYKEMRNEPRKKREDHFWTIVFTFVLIVLTSWVMVYGPRSGVFG